ncbi:methionyl-tRNA formyltransferase [Granulicatella balaenopterae]|uniref:Methionyl-tRNA formyltransferase n=1 Tax=Granulicatella balaenopterae TaxID=137733 RepID=A0A1H9KTD7_9LACT|nr:methionyl-tRNA formyltransferase [Granulicatella balaenopterae]SER02083.1 methionyl-tRNA formyltransferase [Granulicatella balaenopterae]
MKNIIFMGTPVFSTNILEMLLEEGYTVKAVVTQPDKPVGRKKIITPSPVKEVALKHDLPVYQPTKLSGSDELKELMAMEDIDLIVTAAYGQFLPQSFLDFPKYGAVNVHASLLPKYRGGAPIHYSILSGDKETGVTIMRMEKKMDAGNILMQRAIPIQKTDDVASMFEKLSLLGTQLLKEALPLLFAGKLKEVTQDEAKVSFSPNITREQEQIDWNKSAEMVDCFIRGLRPWPSAFTLLEGARYKIWDVTPLEETTKEAPGTMYIDDENRVVIACGDQKLVQVNVIQPAGKAKMDIKAYQNGFKALLETKPVFEGKING